MARKGKNEDFKNVAQNQEGGKKIPYRKKVETTTTTDCEHSIGIPPYLLVPSSGPSAQGEMAMDKLAKLRRLFKKEFGYKPVGRSEEQLEEVLNNRGVTT